MTNIKIKELIPHLDYHDLLKLKQDLDKGSIHIRKLVNETIKKKEIENELYCSVCMAKIAPNQKSYTLLFGPADFKKKASFDGIDCLEYFIQKLKK